MLGTLYLLIVLVLFAIGYAFAYPYVISAASLPGTLIYIATRRSRLRIARMVVGSVFAFAGQFYVFSTIAAAITYIARRMITEHSGIPWLIWPLAFIGTVLILAMGGRDSKEQEKENPEIRANPMHIVSGWTWICAIVMFVVFAIWPSAMHPLWGWLP